MDFIGYWGIGGYFLLLILPKPTTRKTAIIQAVLGGPICWIFFIPMAIVEWRKSKKRRSHA